ncbi:GntR family transcriptional regulator [Saccharopolyspora erythraea NRRL 2338]|uniref:GntR-family transcriptional regulator n=2 Tax=Saccharopolyspora erythraea TaxID=1836 RepID=A4FPW6_SACEN|nr:PLP-dependent aminotransferase family protein [Saccharopolyspora erythraea]PFG99736.1 GntR family transcriptional regulator [Saccharopolyspora erythraea NRRL 2338]QRK89614.1 PLP-dependent aminotransferase family protein [Saccharopolyspora erythraea]CAM06091.1 GntR-family transcriptional regulator [Saccharopolyspora erythraea NRRL 2338]
MEREWQTLRELLLPAVAGTTRGKRGRTVENELRGAIRDGRLPPGSRVPSSRDLAGQLGLSRGTVAAAYNQLVAEGYLIAERGSGTRVTSHIGTPADGATARAPRARVDLHPGLPSLSSFPRAEWLAAHRAALADLPNDELGYPDPAGLPALRTELSAYLGRVRAVAAEPASLLVTNGAAEGLALVADELHRRGHRSIAVEDPSHRGQSELLASHGLSPVPVPVDEHGIRVDDLAATGCRAVLVTAAHQFPLGVVLHPDRRHRLLEWAAEQDGLVVEDDYDAEHRYDRPALGAMQALAPTRVIYQGSVSKVLAPALRLGWLVLPPALLPELVERKRLDDLGCATLPQAAFAHLLRTGGYDRHLRRTRALYRRRRDMLLSTLSDVDGCEPVGVAAGLHLVLRLPPRVDDRQVQESLADQGIAAPALSGYAHGPAPFPGLVLGYAALSADQIRQTSAAIAAVVGQLCR